MPFFEWEEDESERQWRMACEADAERLQVCRRLIQLVANAYISDLQQALELWRPVVHPHMWDLAMNVVLGLITVDDISDNEIDRLNRED